MRTTSNGPPAAARTSGSDPARGLERREQLAAAAADVENAEPGRDARLQHAGQVTVVVAPGAPGPVRLLARVLVEAADLLDDGLFAGRAVARADEGCARAHWKNQ
jgi:hypothetical protein